MTAAVKARPAGAPPREEEVYVPREVRSDLAGETEAYLRSLTAEQLLCLAYGHVWPRLDPREDIPGNFSFAPVPRVWGVYQVTEECTCCAKVRTYQTLPRGIFNRSRDLSYADPAGWEVRPAGSRLTRLDFLNEIWRRVGAKKMRVLAKVRERS